MLKIRLKRAGGRNRPFYRVVVVDSRKARDSRALEEIGYYNPLEKPLLINVDRERVDYWKERGAQVTDSVKTLLKRENAVHPQRRTVESFTAEAPVVEVKPKKKTKAKTKGAKVDAATGEAAVATAEAPAPVEEPKAEAPKAEEPKAEEPKAEEPKAEEPKAEEPKAEKPKAEAPAEDAKPEEPKAEAEPKADKKAEE